MNKTTAAPFGQLVPFVQEYYYEDLNTTQRSRYATPLVSYEISLLLQGIFMVGLGGLMSIVGIIANTINIIVFIKQGAYKECGSVNLLGLAISDLFVVLSGLYLGVMSVVVFLSPPDLSWNPFDFTYVTGGWSHLMCAQITRAITAYVSFERCICVVLPFKVKTLLTPKRSIFIMLCLFLCVALSYAPAFVIYRLEFKFDPYFNKSRLMRASSSTSDHQLTVDIMWYMNSVTFNVGSVAIVFICTLITVSRVKMSKTWRNSMATGNASTENTTPVEIQSSTQTKTETQKQNIATKQDSKFQKEKRLITMILSISIIFLCCYLPDLMYLLMYSVNGEIKTLGQYTNLALVMYSLTFFMETINSSINILVYYKMSSRYKLIFRQLMGLPEES